LYRGQYYSVQQLQAKYILLHFGTGEERSSSSSSINRAWVSS